jgi:hypothetical protein
MSSRPGTGRRAREAAATTALCLAAAGLAYLAARLEPETRTPAPLADLGESFYPAFTDALACKAIEVVAYNEATATAEPLKVEQRGGRYVLTSHHDYPADAKERLARTAAALMDLRKEALGSMTVSDHERFGVVDPLDAGSAGLVGRGKRVTLRDDRGAVLADLILGKAVEAKPGHRYVRVPGQKSTYAVKTDAEPSARLEDWIDADLLRLHTADVRRIVILNYSVDEQMGGVRGLEEVALSREGDRWTVADAGVARSDKVRALIETLGSLKIVDVQPKPAGLSEDLTAQAGVPLTLDSILALRRRGFFLTPTGHLVSNEGELRVETVKGVVYTLRFGEIAGGGDIAAPSAASAPPAAAAPGDGPLRRKAGRPAQPGRCVANRGRGTGARGRADAPLRLVVLRDLRHRLRSASPATRRSRALKPRAPAARLR